MVKARDQIVEECWPVRSLHAACFSLSLSCLTRQLQAALDELSFLLLLRHHLLESLSILADHRGVRLLHLLRQLLPLLEDLPFDLLPICVYPSLNARIATRVLSALVHAVHHQIELVRLAVLPRVVVVFALRVLVAHLHEALAFLFAAALPHFP